MTAEKKTTKTKAAHERVYICVRQKPGGRAKQSEAGVARFVSCVLGSLAMFWGMPSIKENLTWIACFVLGVILSENTRSGVLVTVFMPVLPLPVLVLLVLISKGGTLEVDIALCFFPPFFFLVCCLPQQIHTHALSTKKNSCVSHSPPSLFLFLLPLRLRLPLPLLVGCCSLGWFVMSVLLKSLSLVWCQFEIFADFQT